MRSLTPQRRGRNVAELKHCPFCRGAAAQENNRTGCFNEQCPVQPELFGDDEEAAALWNARAETPAAPGALPLALCPACGEGEVFPYATTMEVDGCRVPMLMQRCNHCNAELAGNLECVANAAIVAEVRKRAAPAIPADIRKLVDDFGLAAVTWRNSRKGATRDAAHRDFLAAKDALLKAYSAKEEQRHGA